ncbi:MAG: hypothetical protein ACI8SJ_000123 [Shewanella sp.]|jgi:hypothetical protein
MSQLKTDWVRIATEGQTFRNVPIERQWLVDIAETYTVETYGARIWPDHRRWYGAWGDVLEVKTEEQDGKLRLFAKLKPNTQLISANEQDQKVFTSIELDPNFAQSGKAYLTGLGVTDEPASLGTDRLKFSTKERFDTHQYGAPEQLVISYSDVEHAESDEQPKQEKHLYSILKNFFKSHSPELAPEPSEEEPMNKEQFEALMGQFTTFGTRLEGLESKVEAFGKKPEGEQEGGDKGKPEGEQNTGKPEGATITTEQFSTLNESLMGLVAKFEGMETKFNALSQETGGQEPDPAGAGESFTVV